MLDYEDWFEEMTPDMEDFEDMTPEEIEELYDQYQEGCP